MESAFGPITKAEHFSTSDEVKLPETNASTVNNALNEWSAVDKPMIAELITPALNRKEVR